MMFCIRKCIDKILNIIFHYEYIILKHKWDYYAKTAGLRIHVLMYHHVTDEIIDEIPSCVCKIDVFKNTLACFFNKGATFISTDEIINVIENNESGEYVVVTFDDVPQDFYSNAYPILHELQIPFTLFVTTSFLDKEGFLSRVQLIMLDQDALCTIGAHTISHPMLRKSKDLATEIQESKKVLEQLLKHDIDIMAYPFGSPSSVSNKVKKEVRKSGYKMAFGTVQSLLTPKVRDMYYLPRIVINK